MDDYWIYIEHAVRIFLIVLMGWLEKRKEEKKHYNKKMKSKKAKRRVKK